VNGLQLPRWIVPVAGLAAAVWAVAMWWMVASLPAGGASEAELDLIVARAEIERLQLDVDELSQEIATLHQQRGELALRVDSLEESRLTSMVSEPAGQLAGAPPADPTPEATPVASEDGDEGEDTEADAEASPTATPSPTSEPTATATVEPTPAPATVQYFTDGRDKYSCRDFDSWEEAQAAYEANLPGDPNKIDIDGDGIACEALR
jgi:hypothetical protein